MRLIKVPNEYRAYAFKCAKCGKFSGVKQWYADAEDKPWTCYCESCSKELSIAEHALEIGMSSLDYKAFVKYISFVNTLNGKSIFGPDALSQLAEEVKVRGMYANAAIYTQNLDRVYLDGNTINEQAKNLIGAIEKMVKEQGIIKAIETYDIRPVTAVYPFAFEYALVEEDGKRNQAWQHGSDKKPSLIYSLYRRFLESYRHDADFMRHFGKILEVIP